MSFVRPPFDDPAAEAARLLQRLAFIIMMIIAPVAEIVSHGVLYVLLPVGAGILVVAGLLVGTFQAPRHVFATALTPIGLAVAFLTFWSTLSLLWTLFPDEAAARLGRTLLTGAIVMLAIHSQPERTKISNIYLLPIGIAITAAATFAMIMFGPTSFWKGSNPDYTLAQRSIMSIAVLLWPAVGALALRERFVMAAALALLVGAAVLAAFFQVALAALMVAAVVYVAAMTNPKRTAQAAAYSFAALLLVAPLLAALIYPFAVSSQAPYANPISIFSYLVVHEWPRFITGHGLNMVERTMIIGALPPQTPHSIVFMLWYELGIIGVAAFAFLMAAVFVAAGDAPAHSAPAILATLVAGLVIAILGTETTQLWWVTLNGIGAIALALLVRAHPRAKRPLAPAAEEEEGEADETEDPFDLYRMSEY